MPKYVDHVSNLFKVCIKIHQDINFLRCFRDEVLPTRIIGAEDLNCVIRTLQQVILSIRFASKRFCMKTGFERKRFCIFATRSGSYKLMLHSHKLQSY